MTACIREGVAPRPSFDTLSPTRPDYALAPILDSFTWSECFRTVDQGQWYLVVFRSVRYAHADTDLLTEFDDHAYDEALGAGGLLHYFKGQPGAQRECLSFCIWESQEQARAALHLPRHIAAMRIASTMYESYTLERYHLSKQAGSAVLTAQHL